MLNSRRIMSDSKTVTSQYRTPLGAATFNENVCSFLVWAPRAGKVEIRVSKPRDREILMQAIGRGYFHAFVEDIAAGAENYEGRAQVFRVAAGLFLSFIGVEVGSLGFEYAKRAALSGENVIGAAAVTVQFKAHPTVFEEFPAALSEGLVDQDSRKCFRPGRQVSDSAKRNGIRGCQA